MNAKSILGTILIAIGVILIVLPIARPFALTTYTGGAPYIEPGYAMVTNGDQTRGYWQPNTEGTFQLDDDEGSLKFILIAYEDEEVTDAEVWLDYHVLVLSYVDEINYDSYSMFRFMRETSISELKSLGYPIDWNKPVEIRFICWDDPSKSTPHQSNTIDFTVTFLPPSSSPPSPPPSTVEGYFEINGVKVEEDSMVTVRTREVTFKLTITSGAEKVSGAYITVFKQGWTSEKKIDMNQQASDIYEASYSFTEDGVYTVTGNVVSDGESYRLMSLVMPMDKMTVYGDFLLVLGVLSLASGSVLLIIGKKE